MALTLALIFCLALAACGNSNDSDAPGSPGTSAPKITFEETTLVENDDIVIKITDVTEDDNFGFTAKFYLENKTDKTLLYSMIDSSINSVMIDPLWAKEVAPGKKANSECSWPISSYEDEGIIDIPSKIDFSLRVYDSDDFLADPILLDDFAIYPYGEDQAKDYVYNAADSDVILVDNEYARVIVRGYDPDTFWGYSMRLYIENKTDKNVMFSMAECSVNGFMLDPFWASEVPSGKMSFSSVSWSDREFEENDISEVTEISFRLKIYDSDEYTGEYYVNEAFTVNP